jgi:hypothetical protein
VIDESNVDSEVRSLFSFLLHCGDYVQASPAIVVQRTSSKSPFVLELSAIFGDCSGSGEFADGVHEDCSDLNRTIFGSHLAEDRGVASIAKKRAKPDALK